MPTPRLLSAPILLASLIALAACGERDCVKPAAPVGTGLTGIWQLTHRQCFCVPTPLPIETITFADSTFYRHTADLLTQQGSYTLISNPITCGLTTTGPGIVLTPAAVPASPYGMQTASYTLSGNTLVLDYGSPCDAARDTYQRLR